MIILEPQKHYVILKLKLTMSAALRELFTAAEHKSQMRQPPGHLACAYAAWVVSGRRCGRRGKGVKDTGGSHCSHSLPFTLTPPPRLHFYTRGASDARVIAIIMCLSVCVSVCHTPVLYHKNSSGDER